MNLIENSNFPQLIRELEVRLLLNSIHRIKFKEKFDSWIRKLSHITASGGGGSPTKSLVDIRVTKLTPNRASLFVLFATQKNIGWEAQPLRLFRLYFLSIYENFDLRKPLEVRIKRKFEPRVQ